MGEAGGGGLSEGLLHEDERQTDRQQLITQGPRKGYRAVGLHGVRESNAQQRNVLRTSPPTSTEPRE